MCKTNTYTYTCAHRSTVRLSTCRGTVGMHRQPGHPDKAACIATLCLAFKQTGKCGECRLADWEESWRIRLEVARTTCDDETGDKGEANDRLAMLEQEYEGYSWSKTTLLFPQIKLQSSRPPKKGYRVPELQRTGSLLRREVRPEDVMLELATCSIAEAPGWDWSEAWNTPGEQLTAKEAAMRKGVVEVWDTVT